MVCTCTGTALTRDRGSGRSMLGQSGLSATVSDLLGWSILLARISPHDLSKAGMPFSTTREIDVGYARVRAARMSYVGGPGYELTVPTDQCLALYEALWSAGGELDLTDAGYYTIDALRIEAGRRAWGAELGPDDTPWEAGLGYAVKLDKAVPFIGREALLLQRAHGLKKRLVLFTFDDPTAFPWGGEPILMDGKNVGELTSAGFSRKLDRAVAMGYARRELTLSDEALLAATFDIDIAGCAFAVTPHLRLA